MLGYTVPHSTGGLNNNFTYKNFTLNIFVDWALGHSINNNSEMRYFMNTFANNYTLIDEVKQCWKQPGDNTKYARFTANDPEMLILAVHRMCSTTKVITSASVK